MKRHALLLIVLLASAVVSPLWAQGPAGQAFDESRAWKKLDADTQQAWKDAMGAADPDRRFDCYVRVRAPADRGDQSFLLSNGFVVRMFMGNVASGYMAAKAVQSVAELSFVDSIRLAKTPDPGVKKVDRPAAKTP